MNPSDLFDNPSGMLRWLEMPEGIIFLEHVEKMLGYSREIVEKESDIVKVYRRQGRIEALKDIFNLPEELRQMLKKRKAA